MPFFDYHQNNSGGSFVADHVAGISLNVVVEADNARHADERAEMIGLYFGGAGDCSCCGDRWYSAYGEGDPVPSVYGSPVEEFLRTREEFDFALENIGGKGKPTVYVHFLSGAVGAY